MKRNIIIVITLILLFSIAAGILYLNNVYLPVKVKGRLASALSTYLNYNVEIEKLKYTPVRGVVIQNIVIYDKTKDRENTVLTVKEASFHILFFPLIKERKIIIPIIHVDSPSLNIRYQQDGTFNFSRIFLPKPEAATKPRFKFSFVIFKINIFGGDGTFADERLTPKFSKSVQDLDIVLGIRQLTRISFLIEGKILTDKGGLTALSARGDYNLLSKEINSKLNSANLIISEFNPYLKTLPFSFADGSIANSDLDLKFKDNLISLKGVISTKELSLRKADLTLTGDVNIHPDLTYAIDKKTLDYKADIEFIQTNLLGIPYIDKMNNISGKLGLEKDKLWTEDLKLQAADSSFTLNGSLENFANPFVKLSLKSEQVNLQKILAVLPSKPQGINLEGNAEADVNVEGRLADPSLDITAGLLIKDAKLQAELLKGPVNAIKGRIDFTEDTAKWSDLSFNYLDTAYTSNGRITDFKIPQITFGLNSKELDLKTDVKIKDKIVRIITFAGKYINSDFAVEGVVDTQDNTTPAFDVSINLNLNPADLPAFLPAPSQENLKKMKPEGILNIKGILSGRAGDYKGWTLALKAASDAFSVYNLKFNNISFGIDQKDGLLNISHFFASGYAGVINLDLVADLRQALPPFSLKLNSSGIDLSKLKSDFGMKDKDISGTLNINADLNGDFKDLTNLKGKGSLSVKDGNLWQLNLLKGLGELFLLPDFEKIVLKEALGDFDIVNKSVRTENLRLTSEQLKLDCKGSLGFDGTLDFTIYTEANKNLIRDSADIRKFMAAILGDLSSALTIKLSGTIQKPKYKIVPVAVDIIKNIKDFLLSK